MTRVKTEDSHGYHMLRRWEVQKPPFKHSLDFYFEKGFETSSSSAGPVTPTVNLGPPIIPGTRSIGASNASYGKLQDSLGNTSTWANNLLEMHQNLDLVSSVAGSLTNVASGLRKKDFRQVIDALGIVQKSKQSTAKQVVNSGKSFGNKWLALHFAIVPMYQDLGNAVQQISKPTNGSKKVSGSHSDHYHDVNQNTHNEFGITMQSVDYVFSAKHAMWCTIENSNAFIAQRLGLVNPLSIAWEAVPYSFVVDWFANVGQVLGALSDMVGVSSQDAYTTTSQVGTDNYTNIQFENKTYGIPFTSEVTSGKSIFIQRVPHLIGPELSVKPFKGLSTVRAATAISLLLQHL